MRRTFITILISVLVTSLCWYVVGSLRRGVERLWLMSAVKAPGRMALEEIEADLQAGRLEVAKTKIAAFEDQWALFMSEAGFRGQGIGNIMVRFGRIDSAAETNGIAEPTSPANGRKRPSLTRSVSREIYCLRDTRFPVT